MIAPESLPLLPPCVLSLSPTPETVVENHSPSRSHMKWIPQGFNRKPDPIRLRCTEQNISYIDEKGVSSWGAYPFITTTEAWNTTLCRGLLLSYQGHKLFDTNCLNPFIYPRVISPAHSPMEQRSGATNWHVPRFEVHYHIRLLLEDKTGLLPVRIEFPE